MSCKGISYEGRHNLHETILRCCMRTQSQIYLYYIRKSGTPAYVITQILFLYLPSTGRGCLLSVNSITFILEGGHNWFKQKLGDFFPMHYANFLITTLHWVPQGGSIYRHYCFIYVFSVMVRLASSELMDSCLLACSKSNVNIRFSQTGKLFLFSQADRIIETLT